MHFCITHIQMVVHDGIDLFGPEIVYLKCPKGNWSLISQ
jgi:hypothetical protein